MVDEGTEAQASEGARLLGIVAERLGSQGKVARELGTTSSLINRYLKGTRKPGRSMAGEMSRRYGIPTPSWDEPPRVEVEDDDDESRADTIPAPADSGTTGHLDARGATGTGD